ncbi:MAG TPA: amidohydrolase family protein [Bacteroidales bacterium]|jgi:cytosine/adenosine deaminase-related metal-dependent hydrolase|nr:amidohydrolase family protein [Bacteroidales bacterium]
MRHFSAQYVFTNEGAPLKRGIVTVSDEGIITAIHDSGGDLAEKRSVEFHNGIIVPGFVNCHCHLELSHMKNAIPPGKGLAEFLRMFREARSADTGTITGAAGIADEEMYLGGIEMCADICNTNHTFAIKKQSRIRYKNFLELFGIDSEKAEKRLDEIKHLAAEAEAAGLEHSIVPHAVYSISLKLFALLRAETESNKVSSVHFMETEAEKMLLEKSEGPLMNSYRESGLVTGSNKPDLVRDHATAVLQHITQSGNLILVHNTFADKDIIDRLKCRPNLFWCLCPNANLYIENKVPPLTLLMKENCKIVIGTDSYASNGRLNILDEIRTLQNYFPSVSLEEMVRFATLNGAEALGEQELLGSIKTGKKPGLLLLKDLDIARLRLLPSTNVRRLV